MKILFVIADHFPTFRPDVEVLFGKSLASLGVESDLVAQSTEIGTGRADWPAGKVHLYPRSGKRLRDQIIGFLHDIHVLMCAPQATYDAVMVRDKVFAGLFGLLTARRLGVPFLYWMSFPMSEAFIEIIRDKGLAIGLPRYLFLAVKGYVGKWLLYRFLLPRANHIFVQSENMREAVSVYGIGIERMTPVPMGVDHERVVKGEIPVEIKARLNQGPVIAYLGALDRLRRLDFLLDVVKQLSLKHKNLTLLMIGDSTDPADTRHLKAYAEELGIEDRVYWTGWINSEDAWRYAMNVTVAASIVPRGEIFDCASPTKVIEYLALGIPVVANDQPDQEWVLQNSHAGISVPMEVNAFATAVERILADRVLAAAMKEAGPIWVRKHRAYPELAAAVYESLAKVINEV